MTSRAVVLGAVALTLVATLAVPMRSWMAQRAEIVALEADVAAASLRVADLQRQDERWQDPAFVAAEARRRLHFVLPGETAYTALGLPEEAPAASVVAPRSVGTMTWHERLWDSILQADAGAESVGLVGGNGSADSRE